MAVELFDLSNASLLFGLRCFYSEPHSWIFAGYTVTNLLLLLPLCVLVLLRGLQRRRPSDSFTCHVAAMEIVFVCGCILCCCGSHAACFHLVTSGFCLFSFSWYGETLFHTLTCVERYLAAVHPVTYLRLRGARWVRVRGVVGGCVWLLCAGGMCLTTGESSTLIVLFCLMLVSLVTISTCCLSVLRVLTRPGPGERGGARVRVDQSKRRALDTIAAVLAVLLLRCMWSLVWGVTYELRSQVDECVVVSGEVWFTLPSSLLLPVLYLHRVGTIRCRKTTN